MKKIVLSFVAAVALACCLTSCNTGEGCYLVTSTISIPGMDDQEETFYYYGTNDEIDAYASARAAALPAFGTGAKVTTSYIKVLMAESDCKTAASIME